MNDATAPRGLLLFAHGARDAAWAAPFQAVVQRVRTEQPALQVALAFLELMLPDLPTAAARWPMPAAGASMWCRCSSAPAAMCATTCRAWCKRCASTTPAWPSSCMRRSASIPT